MARYLVEFVQLVGRGLSPVACILGAINKENGGTYRNSNPKVPKKARKGWLKSGGACRLRSVAYEASEIRSGLWRRGRLSITQTADQTE